ncbi:MAG: molybdopterin-dependent oxidoreductase [Opitutaceae bacterium]|nr:molybdopterin-dependent oxidoreductase [Opitutaceae bacterium]
MNMERRDFLRTTAMAAATAVIAQRLGAVEATPASHPGATTAPDGITWDKAPCRFCGTGCHVRVGVKDGRVVAIQGEQLAEVNKGLLCVKGYHVGGILYGQDRLTTPMLRRNGVLAPITWEEAIDVVAQRVMKDPKGFAFYGSGQWTIPEGYAAQKFMKGGLANNHIEPNARLCMASAVTGYLSVYGVDEPAGCYDDLDAADVVILWGNNPAEMHPVLFSRLIERRTRGQKVTLIDLGTRRTRTTEHADEYLEFRPNSDLAIANGIAHLLLKTNSWDRDFVAKHCNFRGDNALLDLLGKPISFEDYRAAVEPYTPDYVEQLSGVPAAKLRMLAELFGRRDVRITSLWCMGMNQHNRGTAINRLVHSIHLLSGHFGRPGDAPTSLTGQPSACGTAREVGTMCHFLPGGRLVANPEHREQSEEIWKVPAGRINPKPGYHTVQLFEKFCTPTEKGGDIHTIIVQVTNPGQTLPNLHKLFLAKEGLADKFLIVSEVYPTATTALADLVLPAALWVEKNGIYGNSERRTQQWFKQVEPPGQARPDAWMTIAVAHRLFELGHPGMNDGSWKETKFRFTEGADPFVAKGKGIQFYHSVTKDDRALIWFCPYEPATEAPDPNFPTWLCTGRVLEHWHTGTLTMRVPQLRNAMPNAYVEMNPEDAAAAGLGNGDLAVVETRRGKIELPVWLNGRARPPRGSVFVPFFDERLMINELTLGEPCPISKQPDYKKCAVKVTRKGGEPLVPIPAPPHG